MKHPSELFINPPHERSTQEPCFACGQRWSSVDDGPNRFITHEANCLWSRWQNLPEQEEEAPLTFEGAMWILDAAQFFVERPELLQ